LHHQSTINLMSASASKNQQHNQGPAPVAKELIADIKTWHYKNPERNQKGGFSGYIVRKPGDFERICFQATAQLDEPRCVAPFGISKPFDATKEDSNKRNFELNIMSARLHEFLTALDENTQEQAVKNYELWFNSGEEKKKKKPLTAEDIRGMYRPLVQEGDEKKGYAPIFRTKVVIEGTNQVRVFVHHGVSNGKVLLRPGSLSDITPFVECIPIIEVVGMWFMSKQFGLSLTTTDVVVFPKSKRPAGQFNFGGELPQIETGVSSSSGDGGFGGDDMDIVPSEEAAQAAAERAAKAAIASATASNQQVASNEAEE